MLQGVPSKAWGSFCLKLPRISKAKPPAVVGAPLDSREKKHQGGKRNLVGKGRAWQSCFKIWVYFSGFALIGNNLQAEAEFVLPMAGAAEGGFYPSPAQEGSAGCVISGCRLAVTRALPTGSGLCSLSFQCSVAPQIGSNNLCIDSTEGFSSSAGIGGVGTEMEPLTSRCRCRTEEGKTQNMGIMARYHHLKQIILPPRYFSNIILAL